MQDIMPFSGKLTKYYRQPKVNISLPSKGRFYPPGAIEGDIENIPVFAMNAMDELLYKNPDALFSGEATVSVISSCVPAIKDPWLLSQLDIDTVLIGIRIATYGEGLDLTFKCEGCKEEQGRIFNLLTAIDYFSTISYTSQVNIGPLTFNMRPLTYKEATNLQLQAYKLQKTVEQQASIIDEEAQMKKMDEFYRTFALLQSENIVKQIESVEAEGDVVSNSQEIVDFIKNSETLYYDGLKSHIEEVKQTWRVPLQPVECESCNHKQDITISLDSSIFFVKK
jgi:hypothetical protein